MLGTEVGGYRVESALGAGGMGTVWLASAGARRVAVKVIHPHLASSADARARFLREAEIGRRVSHRNVVATLDAGEEPRDGAPMLWLAMEFVEGQTLRALAAELGRVPEELCRHVALEVARGLGAIHAAGAIHRDVKPENVIITRDNTVKVMDLGVARGAADRVTATGSFVGSLHYASPEQFTGGGKDVDRRSDLHALGVTLYEIATGVHPFAGADVPATVRRVMQEVPRRAAEVHPQISPFFEEVVAKLLAKRRDERFASAEDLCRVLEDGEASPWWRLRAAELRAAAKHPPRRLRISRESEVVGREGDLALLRSLFERASAGDSGFALVEGEAGIGKSRFVDEFVRRLEESRAEFQFLHGSWPPGGAATGPSAFAAALLDHYGDAGIDDAVRRALPTAPRLAPAFAALLRGDATPAGAEPLTKETLQTAFVHAARSLAAERPTILFVDDLHHAPPEGRAILAALVNAAPGHRLFVVAAARPSVPEEWTAEIEGLPHVVRLRLPRLADEDAARILDGLVRARSAMDELPAQILRKAGGNPFFLFEIVRGLRDGGVVEPGADGRLVRGRTSVAVTIPSTLRDMTRARLAGLSQEDRELLDVASCCGDEFDPSPLVAVLGTARIPLLRQLGRIERTHRLVRAAGMRCAFDHHQVREALYSSLSDALRREYHAALGDAIEAHSAAGDGAAAVELCGHFLRGTEPVRALRHLDAALAHLTARSARAKAAELAALALSAPRLLTGRERLAALIAQAARLDFVGRRDDERRVLDEALPLAASLGDAAASAAIHRHLGWNLTCTSRYEAARDHLARALETSRASGDRRGEEHATRILGITYSHVGRFEESCAMYRDALEIAREIGSASAEAASTINLGIDTYALGRFDEARALSERGLELARQTGERRYEINATASLLNVSHMLGLLDEALARARETLRLAREAGARTAEATALANLGDVQFALGDAKAALSCYEDAVALSAELGDRRSHGRRSTEVGGAREELRDLAGAEAALRQAREMLSAIGDAAGGSLAALRLGALLARDGRHEEARAMLAEAKELADASDSHLVQVLATARLALLPGGDRAAAADAFERHGARLEMQQRMEALHLLAAATGEREKLAEAKRLLDHLVAHAPADRREAMVANVRVNREIAEAARAAGIS